MFSSDAKQLALVISCGNVPAYADRGTSMLLWATCLETCSWQAGHGVCAAEKVAVRVIDVDLLVDGELDVADFVVS